METTEHSRLGGELPLFADRPGKRRVWAPNWLGFSHGRAALAWLIERRRPKSALICAYTCPTVPAFLRRAGVAPLLFDVGASAQNIVALAEQLPAPRLVMLPALFGNPPWLDPNSVAKMLGRTAIVVIDAAQTAFGHRDFRPPSGGATFSCPRKTTALADGAVLALGRGVPARSIARLPVAHEAAAWKYAARSLWATAKPDFESQALEFNRISEAAWPDRPHRMSDASRVLIESMDADWHRATRRRNAKTVAEALAGKIPAWASTSGVPFSLPIFVRDPGALIEELKTQRIFATRLWPDSEHDPDRQPAAAYMVSHLVSLPVDQRHEQSDMKRIAATVLRRPDPPSGPMPLALRHMVRE
jgi:hypothetical protein